MGCHAWPLLFMVSSEDSELSIKFAEEALDQITDTQCRADILEALSWGKCNSYLDNGSIADLENSIALLKDVTGLFRPDDFSLLKYNFSLSERLGELGFITGDRKWVDEAVGTLSTISTAILDGNPSRATWIWYKAKALLNRAFVCGAREDVVEALDMVDQAISTETINKPRFAVTRLEILYVKSQFTNDPALTEQWHQAAKRCPQKLEEGDSGYVTGSQRAFSAYRDYEMTGDLRYLKEAVGRNRETLESCKRYRCIKTLAMKDLAMNLIHVYERTGSTDMGVINEAVAVAKEALETFINPDGNILAAEAFHTYGKALWIRSRGQERCDRSDLALAEKNLRTAKERYSELFGLAREEVEHLLVDLSEFQGGGTSGQ
jgi:hypothetical protein